MCGIAGIVGAEGQQVRAFVNAMNSAMAVRGPDDSGEWQHGPVCLGHRRLSIIDCSAAGHQPMLFESQDGTHAITFNGEIYNFPDLRRELVAAGVPLFSRSDTEVLLHVLRTCGTEKALQRLHGMFAFAYWCPAARRLLIVRDRLGIKPVYYHLSSSGVLSFASSLSALLENKEIPRRLDYEALEEFLATGCPIAPNTLYVGVHELPAGHLLEWQAGSISIRPYWEPNWENRYQGTEEQAREEFGEALDQALREHLISDVPVGAFLSGGLDSSTIVARASRLAGESFETFSVRFDHRKYDETPIACDVARYVGVKHSVIPMAGMPVDMTVCRHVLKNVGQPFADSSCLPTYLVSLAASRRAKVVLSGDGGDELFAGYDTFSWAEQIGRVQRLPKLLRAAVAGGLDALAPDRSRRLRKGLRYSLESREEMLLRLKCIFDPEEIARFSHLYAGRAPKLERLRDFLAAGSKYDLVTALSRWHMVFLTADMLRKVDCMSMAASIEVRVPLLDYRIVEFAQSLPITFKVRNGTRKWLMREYSRPYLPDSVFEHPKWGFAIPLHLNMTDDFIRAAAALLLREHSFARQLIRLSLLKALCSAIARRVPLPRWSIFTTSHMFWMLAQMEVWLADYNVSA